VRILMVSQFYAPVVGGQERAVQNIGVALARRGHHVALATLWNDGLPEFEVNQGVRVHRVRGAFQRAGRLFTDPQRPHLPPMPDPQAVRGLRRVIAQERPDVIHAHDWFVHSLVALQRHHHVPLVLSLHDHSLTCANKRLMQGDDPCSGPALGKCVRCASAQYGVAKGVVTALALRARSSAVERSVDRFLPVSESLAGLSGVNSGDTPFTVLPNFILDDAPGGAGDERDADLPAGQFVLFVGDATRDKGIDVLLEAHRRLGPAPPLVVIGRPLTASIAAGAPGVVVLGTRPHDAVLRALRRAAVTVVPSLCPETFGLVALEAMSMGSVVIAARSGGLSELVVDGVTGVLTPPGEPEALAEALRRVLGDAELRMRMASAARQRVERFREEPVIGELERIYRDTIESTGPVTMPQGTAG
jgi:glycosyltransferase involved in cell wall biosynthesis